jgi:hypothetical protein
MVGSCLFLSWWRIKRPIFSTPSGCLSPSISKIFNPACLLIMVLVPKSVFNFQSWLRWQKSMLRARRIPSVS